MPEVGETYITPRTNPFLLGHEEAEKFLLDAWKNNSLHNSWLFSGIEGIGKATPDEYQQPLSVPAYVIDDLARFVRVGRLY